jgi:hypothetical protein
LWTRVVKGGAGPLAGEHAAAEEGEEHAAAEEGEEHAVPEEGDATLMSVRERGKGARAGGVGGGGEEREERLQVWMVELEHVKTVQVTKPLCY